MWCASSDTCHAIVGTSPFSNEIGDLKPKEKTPWKPLHGVAPSGLLLEIDVGERLTAVSQTKQFEALYEPVAQRRRSALAAA
jgi:hypothetical protein